MGMMDTLTQSLTTQTTSPWLIRISKNFEHFSEEIIGDLGATLTKRLGEEYFLIKCSDSVIMDDSTDASKYIRWKLSMDHAWPCNPEKMENFLDKAAQALVTKFGEEKLQGVFVGVLDPNSKRSYYKNQATKLNRRILQLFGNRAMSSLGAEKQFSDKKSLFCLVGKEGLYCGIRTPLETNGFYPGGTKFISQKAPHTISRAGAKVVEALHHLSLHQAVPQPGAHWLDLGASPGGMTSELLERNYRVTAIDRAPLDDRLKDRENLRFIKADVTRYNPSPKAKYDAILCDMNGDVETSLVNVLRLSGFLKKNGLVIFTLKTTGAESYQETNQLYQRAIEHIADARLKLVACTHLTYNRHEFTLFLK